MTIIKGSASGGTGLAGRLAAKLAAAFGYSYPAASDNEKSLEAIAGAFVDALDNDKVGAAQTDGGGGLGGGWSLATKPTSPDTRDEEFEGTAFAGWTDIGTRISTAIDPYASFSTAASWRHSWNAMRPGWLMLQASRDGSAAGITKSVTYGTNEFLWARVAGNFSGTASAGAQQVSLTVSYSATESMRIGLIRSATQASQLFYVVAAGGAEAYTFIDTDKALTGGGQAPQIEYFAIHKVGNNWHFWAAALGGIWVHIATVANAALSARGTVSVSAYIAEGTNTANADYSGNFLAGFDFIRFKATATEVPP